MASSTQEEDGVYVRGAGRGGGEGGWLARHSTIERWADLIDRTYEYGRLAD